MSLLIFFLQNLLKYSWVMRIYYYRCNRTIIIGLLASRTNYTVYLMVSRASVDRMQYIFIYPLVSLSPIEFSQILSLAWNVLWSFWILHKDASSEFSPYYDDHRKQNWVYANLVFNRWFKRLFKLPFNLSALS